MNTMRHSKTLLALFALLLILGACKGESPTAPPPGSSNPPNGNPTPTPTGFDIALTASLLNPLVDSTVTITATVTNNGQPVPIGTAIEFTTTRGAFDGTSSPAVLKTTNASGVATVLLSSSEAGLARVTAIVNNVSRSIDVTYQTRPVTPPPPNTTPTITSVTPALGRPAGGETIRIIGTNFRAPVRVLFNTGGNVPVEATVTAVTPTTIDVITPGVNVGTGQQLVADIIVFVEAGTASEQRVEAPDAFTYRNVQLTPIISTATPNSGPVTGGTMITIFGEGFQAPVQVLFGAAEARVITVDYSKIVVEAPTGRDTSEGGSETVTGFVPITVRNINSNLADTLDQGFRYVASIQITGFQPASGPASGGTDVVIDGIGFVGPVEVRVAGVPATVLRVSGTQILVRTNGLGSPCNGVSAGIEVTNIVNGDSDVSEHVFTYLGIDPVITAVSPGAGVTPGGALQVVVRDPGVGPFGTADARFEFNGRVLIPSPSTITNGAGSTTFNVAVPLTGFTFTPVACTTTGGFAGTQLGALELPLSFRNITTGCEDTTSVTILPPSPNPCVSTPRPTVTTPAGGSCATPGEASVSGVGTPLSTQSAIVISNSTESQPLNITNVAISGEGAAEFRITPTSASGIAAGGSQNFTLTFDPTTEGQKSATVTFTTNSTTTPTLTVCVQATAVP